MFGTRVCFTVNHFMNRNLNWPTIAFFFQINQLRLVYSLQWLSLYPKHEEDCWIFMSLSLKHSLNLETHYIGQFGGGFWAHYRIWSISFRLRSDTPVHVKVFRLSWSTGWDSHTTHKSVAFYHWLYQQRGAQIQTGCLQTLHFHPSVATSIHT